MKNTPENKARFYLSRYLSLSNAAEFIRGHGEEGHSFEDEQLNRMYLRSNQILSNQLEERSEKFMEKYKALGIDISSEVDMNY